MPYDNEFTETDLFGFKADLIDAIQVFVYTNFSTIVSLNPIPDLPNSTKSVLMAYVNAYPGDFLPKDVQDVTDTWVLTNLNSITTPTPISVT